MAQTVIDNPILNSPFEEPNSYFRFADDGITNEIVEGRRPSGYFLPVPPPKRRVKQLSLESEWTLERFRESEWINRVRERVRIWRQQGHPGVTNTTEKLLRYWTDPEREKRLFFCQVEAAETAIYLTEAATRLGATRGSRMTCGRPMRSTTPACSASPSRWPRAPARRSSWGCSSPGKR